MRDAWRAYLEVALGLTEASRKKAEKTARTLAGKGGATALQLQAMVEDVLSSNSANRESLTRLVRAEVDRALAAVGLVKADEVAALDNRVRELERELEDTRARTAAATAAESVAESATAATGPAPPGPAAEPARPSVTTTAVATNAAARKTVAKKTVSRKTVSKKTVAKKTVPRKATPPGRADDAGRGAA